MMNVMGIIFSNMHEHKLGELTPARCMGSIPVGGRYRLIDFVLSCFVNSGIEDVGVITKVNYQSLMNHLGNGKEWDLARKKGGLVVLPPYAHQDSGVYQNRMEALHGVMNYIRYAGGDYIIMADCDVMMNTTFDEMFEFHQENEADITVMYQKQELPEEPRDAVILSLEPDGRVRDVMVNPPVTGRQNVYLHVVLLSKRLLEYLVGICYSRNQFSFERDILQAGVRGYKICGYEYTGYAARFSSMQSYFETNLALLDSGVRGQLFPRSRPIYTRVRDEAPVRYGLNSRVRNSLLADGCQIEGEVENSVIFRDVRIGKGAVVKNSVIMQSTTVGEGVSLECVITDKNVVIREGRRIAGFQTYPVYISKGSIV